MSRFNAPFGFNPRDRSPPRFGDRRPPAGPRGPNDGSAPFGREPPRGPRALVDSPRGGFGGGRGRGYGRGDFRERDRDLRDRDRDRERDFRDTRDGPPFRRDMDRDWGRRERDFEPREPTRMGFGPGRSRSPARDFRDLREPPSRDLDLVRMRRNSRDSLISASSGGPDIPPNSGGHTRGGSMRGRGRGDWEGGRGRGRPPFLDDRETFRRRSRSRDAWRERGRDRLGERDRDRDRDLDRDRPIDRERLPDRGRERDARERGRDREMDRRDRLDRREDWDSRRPDRDERDRVGEGWKREPSHSRASSRGSANAATAFIPHTAPPGSGREPESISHDQSRQSSSNIGPGGLDLRRENDHAEAPVPRHETKKLATAVGHQSPPPSAPQVPAFGYVPAPVSVQPPAEEATGGRRSNEPFAQGKASRPDRSSQSLVQPPTGPKADRVDRSPDLRPPDSSHHHEETSRAARASTHLSDRSPPTAPAAMVKRDSIPGSGEFHALGRRESMATSPKFARLPPPAPRALPRDPSVSPRLQSSNIPTGPRAYQQRPGASPRALNKGNKPWARSNFGRGPPALNVLPKKDAEEPCNLPSHDDRMQLVARPRSPSLPEESKARSAVTQDTVKSTHLNSRSPSMQLPIRSSSPSVPAAEEISIEGEAQDPTQDHLAQIPDFGRSSDYDEDEENVVFNQEYLDERKRSFEKDMRFLRAEMPPPPLEDPIIASLLLRIQLLGMIAHGEVAAPGPESLPPVEQEDANDVAGQERVVTFAPQIGRPSKPEPQPETVVPPLKPKPEISIESLPFMPSGPPTPVSDLDILHENLSTQERFKEALLGELSRRQKEIAKKNAILREEYMSIYKSWRLFVWEMDRSKDKKPMTPGPASPPAPTVPVTPVPHPEGREGRRYKGNSELDFLNALRASEISAQEELERRRTKMATARPDLTREAVIPDMLERHEQIACVYKDVNNEVEADQAMAVFGFLPPPNDFTVEEHEIFTNAFMAHPKKWGKIAESLPGRTFQQCIMHYYLTKEEIKYKAKLNKRWSRRRNRTKSSRPKSNALIADLGVVKPDFDGEEEPAPVTDTGRPRRAAAPTFGDNEAEGAATGRRAQSSKDGELIEKPASRRGARTAGTRGQRRGRVIHAETRTQVPPPQGNPPLTAGPKTELAGDGLLEPGLRRDREAFEDSHQPLPRSRAGRGRAKEGLYVFDTAEAETAMQSKQPETGYGSLQPTSYWSVPEQRDFPRLLAHFGRDFEGISNFMKTKTTVMVKNYYQRRLDSGQKDFEETLLIAEEKKARGEPTGPLPVPSVAPKRRYEATPSAIVPRTLAPHDDLLAEADEVRLTSKGKPPAGSPQPVPLHGRPLSDNERSSTRYPMLAQASTGASVPVLAATPGEDASRTMRAQTGVGHRTSGPRLGYFTDERRESSMLPQSTIPGRHNPAMPSDLARMDSLASQGYMPAQAPLHLLTPSHSRHPSFTQPPGSPTQLSRPELDISSLHRDPFSQRQYYALPGQTAGAPQSPRPVLSPVKDVSRLSATTAPEAPTRHRQVPAKRSNIMSILNDEPEEPQPRKRLASEQATPGPVLGSTTASRHAYPHGDSFVPGATAKPPSYSLQGPYPGPARGYSEYSSYGPPPGSSGNNDWMARFDPRAQQGAPPSQSQAPPSHPSGRPATSVASHGSYSPYASAPSQAPVNSIPVPSPVPTPPPASQRPSYSNVFSQPPLSQPTGSRESGPQLMAYRPASPPPRASSVAFGSRQDPPTPVQSSSNLFAMPPRQSGAQPSYAPATPSGPAATQPHGQSYQHHVQTMVSGSHQTQRSASVSLPGGASRFGHSTPPPQAQTGRTMPSLATLGRSYTPPSALHPHSGGIGYAPPPSTSGPIPPLHQRPAGPGSLGESASTPKHHRVYSQGSSQGGVPGSLHPRSHPPR